MGRYEDTNTQTYEAHEARIMGGVEIKDVSSGYEGCSQQGRGAYRDGS